MGNKQSKLSQDQLAELEKNTRCEWLLAHIASREDGIAQHTYSMHTYRFVCPYSREEGTQAVV